MTIQLIGIGSQSRLRQVLQTNMDILKEELNLLGIHTPAMPVVADTQQRLQQQVAEALGSGQSVMIVGGIGEGQIEHQASNGQAWDGRWGKKGQYAQRFRSAELDGHCGAAGQQDVLHMG